ncbi:MAG: hypothetical protein ACP5U2_15570 [Bryobacteraceae bacterium]
MRFHAIVFLAPFLTGSWAAAGAVIGTRLLLAARFHHPFWSVLLHPVAEILLLAVGLASWWRYCHGGGVEWKGRSYAAR